MKYHILTLALVLPLGIFTVFSQVNLVPQTRTVSAKQNNPGHPANDFTYVMINGSQKKLYAIKVKYTLLFFYNPECEACKEYKGILDSSTIINSKLKTGDLKILATYIDKDLSIWKKHLPEMPKTWIQGRDNNEYLYKNNVYDLHAIPTIYLLDKNKKVILKDVLDVTLIEKMLTTPTK